MEFRELIKEMETSSKGLLSEAQYLAVGGTLKELFAV